MNFQSVSTAQKLPAIQSSVITGGYLADGNTPGPLLTGALKFVDSQLALLTAAIANNINNASTVIILTAKHGQSPKTPSALLRIDEGAIETALNAAWKVKKNVTPLVALTASDDGLQFWLYDRSVAAVQFTKNFLMSYKGTGTTLNSPFTAAYNSSGLVAAYAGDEVCNLYNVKCPDGRVPDVVGISAYGVIYTGKAKKIAEHGGFNTDDRNVLLVVSGSSLPTGNAGTTITSNVYTIQVAPTILTLLGLDPFRLAAVLIEKTQVLPISYSSVATATVNSPSVSSTSSPSVSSTKYVQTSTAYAGKSFAATLAGLSMTLSAFFFL